MYGQDDCPKKPPAGFRPRILWRIRWYRWGHLRQAFWLSNQTIPKTIIFRLMIDPSSHPKWLPNGPKPWWECRGWPQSTPWAMYPLGIKWYWIRKPGKYRANFNVHVEVGGFFARLLFAAGVRRRVAKILVLRKISFENYVFLGLFCDI